VIVLDTSVISEPMRSRPDAAVAEAAGTHNGQTAAQIAAIARSRGFAVATRDKTPFQSAGLAVINPWEYA
jgi:predicted nucleic acid-binding protein